MDFLEESGVAYTPVDRTWDEESAVDHADHALPHVDGAVSQTIARAIRDATQTADPARQREAASWLLICCPDIAEQVDLPDLHVEAMTTLAAAYMVAANDVGTQAGYLLG